MVRRFFGPRARSWDERFPDDGPAFDGVLAAGLITHLAWPLEWLRALADVTCVGVVSRCFIRSGARNVATAFASTGWQLVEVDDTPNRYLAIARRVDGGAAF